MWSSLLQSLSVLELYCFSQIIFCQIYSHNQVFKGRKQVIFSKGQQYLQYSRLAFSSALNQWANLSFHMWHEAPSTAPKISFRLSFNLVFYWVKQLRLSPFSCQSGKIFKNDEAHSFASVVKSRHADHPRICRNYICSYWMMQNQTIYFQRQQLLCWKWSYPSFLGNAVERRCTLVAFNEGTFFAANPSRSNCSLGAGKRSRHWKSAVPLTATWGRLQQRAHLHRLKWQNSRLYSRNKNVYKLLCIIFCLLFNRYTFILLLRR